MSSSLLMGLLAASEAVHTSTGGVHVIPEATWRGRARIHAERTRRLLAPGLVAPMPRRRSSPPPHQDGWTALSPVHPVTNFLEEYYHIRGGKGTRRLARFTPALRPGGTLLEGATAEDFATGTLFMKGARILPGEGVLYDSTLHYAGADLAYATAFTWYRSVLANTAAAETVLH